MAAQLENVLKAVGLVIRTLRDPYPYFRGVSRREMFFLPQHFLILITHWIYFFFSLRMYCLAKRDLGAF